MLGDNRQYQHSAVNLAVDRVNLIARIAAGCGVWPAGFVQQPAKPSGQAGRDGQPAQVGYVVVQASSVPIENSLPGRVAAFQISEVRPQVSGVILRRLFAEGSVVRQGQTLYQIDPSIYQAQVAQASANLQSARASAEAATARAARYKPLAEMEAVSKQDYTDALAQARQANAAIAQNNASLRTAQINLRYTRVPAPSAAGSACPTLPRARWSRPTRRRH